MVVFYSIYFHDCRTRQRVKRQNNFTVVLLQYWKSAYRHRPVCGLRVSRLQESEMLNTGNEEDISAFFRHIPDKRWCLVQTRPRNEKYANQYLTADGILVYLPLITKVEIHNRSKRETRLPMFPGYLFACPNLEEETLIRRNKAVWNLKKLSEAEEEILLGDLRTVRICEKQPAAHKLVVNPGLHQGTPVRIKSGRLKGQDAIVIRRVDELSVIINLFFLGRHLEMRWAADDLEA